MSYIRSTSNPECLYIYGDRNKKINITQGSALWGMEKYPTTSVAIPERQFVEVLKKWNKYKYWGNCKYKDITLKEVHLSTKGRPWLRGISWWTKFKIGYSIWKTYYFPPKEFRDGKRVNSFREVLKSMMPDDTEYQWVMTYKGKVVMECWQTTLHYIARNVE